MQTVIDQGTFLAASNNRFSPIGTVNVTVPDEHVSDGSHQLTREGRRRVEEIATDQVEVWSEWSAHR